MTMRTRRALPPVDERRRRTLAALAWTATCALAPVPVLAQAGRVLARAELDPAADHVDLVPDKVGTRFASISLAVRRRAVDVRHVTVVFGNGRRFDIPLRTLIPAGGNSRTIDLPGDDRTVRRVFVRYILEPGASAEIVLAGVPG